MVLRVGGCTLFGVPTTLSMASGCLSAKTQKVASKYLHNLFTQEEFKQYIYIFEFTANRAPPARCRIPIASLLFQSNPKGALCHAFI
jgi:hypothetical protein